MSDFVIMSDTGCDLNKELREKYDVADYIRGIVYFPDGHPETLDLDWGNISPRDYYETMRDRKAMFKTAAPTMEEILTKFENQLSQGKDVLCICISTALSSTYNDCVLAAKDILEKYPDRKIMCVDSLRYSSSLGLLVILAALKRKEGATLEETFAYCEEQKYRIHQMGSMDDLFFLVKTGRVNNFKAFFGSMVGLNLLADFNDNGLSDVIGKFKGKKDATKAILEYISRTIDNPSEQILYVAHSNREEHAKLLADQLREKFNPKDIIITEVGQACGANIGPGLCAAFYLGDPASKNLEKEKVMMDEITQAIKKKEL